MSSTNVGNACQLRSEMPNLCRRPLTFNRPPPSSGLALLELLAVAASVDLTAPIEVKQWLLDEHIINQDRRLPQASNEIITLL